MHGLDPQLLGQTAVTVWPFYHWDFDGAAGTSLVREDTPGPDQPDHMVVYLPDLGGAFFDAAMRHFNTPEALAQGVGVATSVIGALPA